MSLDYLEIENYINIEPNLKTPKPNGFKALEKGDVAYINPKEDVKFVGVIEFSPNTGERGNHYHKCKNEILYIISGKLKAKYWSPDNPSDVIEKVHLKGEKIVIPPMIGHTFEAIEPTIALELSITEFNIEDTFYRN